MTRVATNEDTAVTGNVLANDTDVDAGTTLTPPWVANPAHGTVTLNANGSFTYVPSANFNGSDSFTYKANDGIADSNVATVTICDSPRSTTRRWRFDDAVTTNEDTPGQRQRVDERHGRGRRSDAHGHAGRQRGARHGDAQCERQLHLHAERELQRQRQLHV